MTNLHAACVALGGAGVLIRGASGSGKSSLALLLAATADGALVADDRVLVEPDGDRTIARPHPRLAGMIEMRGQGILSAAVLGIAVLPVITLRLVVDLVEEVPRLPASPADAEVIAGLALPRMVLDRGVRAAGLAPLIVRAGLRRTPP